MSQHDYVLDNSNGATFRADLNGALAAIVGQNSGATAPTVPYAYMLWTDTSTSPATLRMRDGSNAAWVSIGTATTNFGHQPAGNYIYFDNATGAATLPSGNTAQRPGTPAVGQLRFNTATLQFEGYNGTLWSGIGGAGNAILDRFNGTGSQTAFTLSSDPGSANSTTVVISGTVQMKSTYTVSGTTLTFSGAPPAGTGNIEVTYYGALITGVPSDGSVSTAKIADLGVTYGKIQNVTAGKLLGRDTSGFGVVQELPISVDASGNLGLGITPSASEAGFGLQVGSTAVTNYVYSKRGMGNNAYFDGSWRYYATGAACLYQPSTSQHAWFTAPSGTAGNPITFTQAMTLDASGNLQFNSGYGSAATAYGCRAWVNFNGTGTVSIRASGNVSSITDNGVGDYTVNFTNAMPDTSYSPNVSLSVEGTSQWAISSINTGASGVIAAPTTSAFRFRSIRYDASSYLDIQYAAVAVFR